MPAGAQLFVGTSGFSYSGRRGSFYPRGLKAKDMLGYYAGRLRTVEVNTTFYRTQPEDVVAGWVAAVPADFRFAVKAHRRITHNRRMPNLEEALRILAMEAAGFGERLGRGNHRLRRGWPGRLRLLQARTAWPCLCRAAIGAGSNIFSSSRRTSVIIRATQ